MTRSDPYIHYEIRQAEDWKKAAGVVEGKLRYQVKGDASRTIFVGGAPVAVVEVILEAANMRPEPWEITDLARESFRDFLQFVRKLPEHESPFASRKVEEKAFTTFEESIRAVVARELARSRLTAERVSEPAQPVPTHVPGYEAAVSAGAEVRTRIFKSEEMLSSDKFAKVAGYSRETVNKKRLDGVLLALTNGTRSFRYPAWQLETKVQPVVPQLLKLLEDPWAIYFFVTQRSPYLDGKSPLECLRAGEVAQVLAAAEIHAEETA